MRFGPALMAGIALVAAVSFSPALRAGFLNWDDDINFTANPFLNPPTAASLRYLWTHPYKGLYVPLVYTSFALEVWVGGGRPWLVHGTNIVLHILSALSVFGILLLLMPRGMSSRSWAFACAAGALVFAVHPIQVEAVAWVTGRKDTLSGLLALAALWQYLKLDMAGAGRWPVRAPDRSAPQPEGCSGWMGQGAPPRRILSGSLRANARYALATCCFVLALLAKPSAAALPIVAFALDWWGSRRPAVAAGAALAPWFGLAAVWSVIASLVQKPSAVLVQSLPPFWMRPLVAGDAVLFYLRKLFIPVHLLPIYGRVPLSVSPLWGGVALGIVAAAGWFALRKRTLLGGAVAVFAGALLPVLGLVPFAYQIYSTVADRYAYLPMLGAAIAASLAVGAAAGRWKRLQWLVWGAVAVIVAALAALTFRQCSIWRGSESLWTYTIRMNPGIPAAHVNLGVVRGDSGNIGEAMRHFAEATRLNPKWPTAYYDAGVLLARTGKAKDAEQSFLKAVEIDPQYADAQLGLANLAAQNGRLAEAVRRSGEAVRADPGYVFARVLLGAALERSGEFGRAEEELLQALRMNPGLDLVHKQLGILYARTGRKAEAETHFREALRLQPGDAETQSWLEKTASSASSR